MAYEKHLGVFVKTPEPGHVKTRLVPPLTEEDASRLYSAFVHDLFDRLGRLKKIRGTVFYAGEEPGSLRVNIPKGYEVIRQEGGTLGERLRAAFRELLTDENRIAIVIGSDSPDIPIQYIKRAFLKLKHKDAVLGPASDGGYYLVGLKAPIPDIFDDIEWSGRMVLQQTLERIKSLELTFSLLPLWYDVDTPASLQLLADMIEARRIERSGRLPATEAVLTDLLGRDR